MISTIKILENGIGNISRKASSGLVMMISSRVSGMLIGLLSSALLGRMLKPEDYGLVAMASTVLILLNLLKDFGLTSAIVQAKEIYPEQLDAVFWMNLIIAFCVCIIGVLFAPAIATFYDQPEVSNILISMCAALLIGSVSATHSALLRRFLDFNPLMWSEIVGQVFGLFAGVLIAYFYHTYWAIVASQIFAAFATSLYILVYLRWLPGTPKKLSSSLQLIKFGMNVSIFSFLNFFSNQLGAIVIGVWLGPNAAGHFNRAQQLLSLTGSVLMQPVSQIALPVLSRMQNSDAEYRQYYLTLIQRTSLFFGALGAYVIVAGDSVALILLGDQWKLSGEMYRWFGLSIIAVGMASQTGNVLISQNRTVELRHWGFGDAFIRAGSSLLGIFMGALGVAAAFGLSTLFITVPIVGWIVSKKGPIHLKDQFSAMRPGAILAACIVSVGLIARNMYWFEKPLFAATYALILLIFCVYFLFIIDTQTNLIIKKSLFELKKITNKQIN